MTQTVTTGIRTDQDRTGGQKKKQRIHDELTSTEFIFICAYLSSTEIGMNRKKKSMSGWVGMVPENEYCSWVGRSAGAMIAEKCIARKKKCCQNWYLKCTFSKTACVRLAPLNNAMHSQHQDTTVERRHALAQRTAQWAD